MIKDISDTELKIALDNRAFEIQLFWQRSNYFLVLMTALGVATFSVKDELLSPVIAIFATTASYFWFRTNLGSKFWQENWEVEVVLIADEKNIRSFQRKMPDVIAQVQSSLNSGATDGRSYLRRWVDRSITKKYSVTYNMILLSLFATWVWTFVAGVLLIRLADHFCDWKAGYITCHSYI